jgi:hypothetical protein
MATFSFYKLRHKNTIVHSHVTHAYNKLVVSVRLALRSTSPISRQRLFEEYVALLAENPSFSPCPAENATI